MAPSEPGTDFSAGLNHFTASTGPTPSPPEPTARQRAAWCRAGSGVLTTAAMTEVRKAPARDAILAAHRFPGPYEIKAFGPAGDAFRDAVLAHAHAVAGAERITVSERSTRSGDRVCVSVTVYAEAVEQVEEVYDRLHLIPELLLIL